MKKLFNMIAALAALAFIGTGFTACSGGDDDSKPSETFTNYTWTVLDTDEACTTYEVDAGVYTIKASSKGTFETSATIEGLGTLVVAKGTYTVSGTTLKAIQTKALNDAGTALEDISEAEQIVMVFTVGEGNVLTFTGVELPPAPETVYAWNFQATDLLNNLSWTAGVASGSVLTGTEFQKVKLEAAGSYESTPAGLTLNFSTNAYFNKVSPSATLSSGVTAKGATAGHIEPDGAAASLPYVTLQGPFTVTMICAANSNSGKDDRYAFIKIGEEEVAAPNKNANTLSGTGEVLTYAYSGTDTVTVYFGGTNIVRIHDIKISTSNGDATGKTAGEVKTSATFTPETNSNTANDAETLGLVGISVTSSAEAVATAEIDNGNIAITSVSAGSAVITVSDGTNEATIEVAVSTLGAVTVTKINKYSSAPKATIAYFASSGSALSYDAVVTDSESLLTSAGTAVFTAVNAGIGEANWNTAKAVKGLSCGNAADLATTAADEEFFNVAFTVTPAESLVVSKLAAYAACNKTSDFKVEVLVNGGSLSDKQLVIKSGSSNLASFENDIEETVALAADTEYTFTVKFLSTKGRTYAAVADKQFTLADLVLTVAAAE